MKVFTGAVCLLSLFATSLCTIPSYIKICQRNDEKLAECIISSVTNLRERLKTGIPELNVPAMEPLHIDRITFAKRESGLSTNLTNLKVSGVSDFEIIKIVPTLTKKGHTFRIEARVPKLHVVGDYEVNTNILQLKLDGKGPFTADLNDYHFECIMKGRRIEKNERTYLEFPLMQCNSVISKASVYLHNLFGGNKVLEEATNQAISENSDALFQDIWPEISDAVRAEFTDIANKITLSFSYDELFP
ncbi:hypothetical protein RI129_004356 [Pyrocoelia pectoralis]|uniref:Uncharacterized protein n=1 Tax=Pyrocoelia pectoralis TaxID=417401 RepID=A0AAN7ZKG6_9COLE